MLQLTTRWWLLEQAGTVANGNTEGVGGPINWMIDGWLSHEVATVTGGE